MNPITGFLLNTEIVNIPERRRICRCLPILDEVRRLETGKALKILQDGLPIGFSGNFVQFAKRRSIKAHTRVVEKYLYLWCDQDTKASA